MFGVLPAAPGGAREHKARETFVDVAGLVAGNPVLNSDGLLGLLTEGSTGIDFVAMVRAAVLHFTHSHSWHLREETSGSQI